MSIKQTNTDEKKLSFTIIWHESNLRKTWKYWFALRYLSTFAEKRTHVRGDAPIWGASLDLRREEGKMKFNKASFEEIILFISQQSYQNTQQHTRNTYTSKL